MSIVLCDSWYALFTVTGDEENVKKRLEYRFGDSMRVVVPKRKLRERRFGKWHTVIRPLFPGYVLINGEMDVETYYSLKGIPGLLRLIKADIMPQPINYWEMEVISRLICNDDTIGFSSVLKKDGKVVVIDGPLLSLEGRIVSINHRKGRAKVNLTFMGEPRVVELGIEMLQPT